MPYLLPFPDIDPVLVSVELFGLTFSVRWYALAYVAGFAAAWAWMLRLTATPRLWKAESPPLPPDAIERLITWSVFGVVLGGRLGYVLFYNPGHYITDPLGIFAVWEGGMSFHGGALGAILAGFLLSWRYNLPFASIADMMAFSVPFGLFLGRVANFINAELWGRPTDVAWAVVFPGARASQCPSWWTAELCSRHPSQLYEAGLEGVLLFAVLAILAYRYGWLRTPGKITGAFMCLYGAARSFIEIYREPDSQFVTASNPFGHAIRFGTDAGDLGFTMGQLLSLPMVAAGLAILLLVSRRSPRAAA